MSKAAMPHCHLLLKFRVSACLSVFLNLCSPLPLFLFVFVYTGYDQVGGSRGGGGRGIDHANPRSWSFIHTHDSVILEITDSNKICGRRRRSVSMRTKTEICANKIIMHYTRRNLGL